MFPHPSICCLQPLPQHASPPAPPPLDLLSAAADSVRALEKKPKAKAAQERALGEVVAQCLVAPFVDASAAGNRAACTALAQVGVRGVCVCVDGWVLAVVVGGVGKGSARMACIFHF